jgi:hypothetical protein
VAILHAQDVKPVLIYGDQMLLEELVLDQDQSVLVLRNIQQMDIHAFHVQMTRLQPTKTLDV